TAVACPGQVARVAVDVDLPPAHLRACPIADVAADGNLAATHLGAQVHAGVAFHGQAARGHARSDPLDAAAVAFDDDLLIARVALHSEELAQRFLAVAVLHRQFGDLGGALARELVRR